MARKILIIGPAWVGDMVMAQSLFKLLKHHDANVVIDVLAPAWTFSLLNRMREVSCAIETPFAHGELKLLKRYQLAKSLEQARYDQAIVLPNSFKSALIPWFANIPIRTGWMRECRYGLLNDYRHLDKKRYPRMIDQFIALGLPPNAKLPLAVPYPTFDVSTLSQEKVLAKYQLVLSGRPILAVCAGAEFGPSKRWPEEYYAEVAKQKINEGFDVWLFGSQKDRPITDKIMQLTEHRCENLAGRTALSETIDLLSLVSGMVTNDSGLMHIGAALKKPLIAIYGSTSPAFTPPLSQNATILKLDLPCQPCFERACPLSHHHCMRHLTPDRIMQAMVAWGGS